MRSTCKKVLTFTPRTREGKKGGGQRKYLAQFLLHSPPQKHVGGGSVARPSRIPPLPPHLQTLPAGPLRPPVQLAGPEVRPPAASRLPDESGFPRDVPLTLPCRLSVVVCSRWNGKASRGATAAQLSAGVCAARHAGTAVLHAGSAAAEAGLLLDARRPPGFFSFQPVKRLETDF